jgi:hypothetical protein
MHLQHSLGPSQPDVAQLTQLLPPQQEPPQMQRLAAQPWLACFHDECPLGNWGPEAKHM